MVDLITSLYRMSQKKLHKLKFTISTEWFTIKWNRFLLHFCEIRLILSWTVASICWFQLCATFFGPTCTLARHIYGDYFDANFRWSVFWHLSCKVGPLCAHLTSLLWNNNILLCCWVQNVAVCLCLILIRTFVLLPLFEWFLVLFLTLLQCTSSTSIKSFGLSNWITIVTTMIQSRKSGFPAYAI